MARPTGIHVAPLPPQVRRELVEVAKEVRAHAQALTTRAARPEASFNEGPRESAARSLQGVTTIPTLLELNLGHEVMDWTLDLGRAWRGARKSEAASGDQVLAVMLCLVSLVERYEVLARSTKNAAERELLEHLVTSSKPVVTDFRALLHDAITGNVPYAQAFPQLRGEERWQRLELPDVFSGLANECRRSFDSFSPHLAQVVSFAAHTAPADAAQQLDSLASHLRANANATPELKVFEPLHQFFLRLDGKCQLGSFLRLLHLSHQLAYADLDGSIAFQPGAPPHRIWPHLPQSSSAA